MSQGPILLNPKDSKNFKKPVIIDPYKAINIHGPQKHINDRLETNEEKDGMILSVKTTRKLRPGL